MAPTPKSTAAVRRSPQSHPQQRHSPGSAQHAWDLLDDAGLSDEIGFVLRMAQLALFEDLLNRLSELKLTLGQLTALRLIKSRPGLPQQRIGDALRIKKTNLVLLFNKLEHRGLVSRRSSALDGRANALHLTAKGERSLAKAMQALTGHAELVARILDQAEQKRTVKTLRKLAIDLHGLQQPNGAGRSS